MDEHAVVHIDISTLEPNIRRWLYTQPKDVHTLVVKTGSMMVSAGLDTLSKKHAEEKLIAYKNKIDELKTEVHTVQKRVRDEHQFEETKLRRALSAMRDNLERADENALKRARMEFHGRGDSRLTVVGGAVVEET